MEEINLKELLMYIKERIFVIVVITLFITTIGCVYSCFFKTPLYKSSSTVLLVSDDGTSSGGASTTTQSDVQLNKSLVTTYSELVTSRTVLKTVIENLSLKCSVSDLEGNIFVSNQNDTEIINIEVSNADKQMAAAIANEVVDVFGEEIKRHYKLQNVSVVDEAEVANDPYNINYIKDTIIYVLIGFIISAGIVFIFYYFDTTIKSAEDVENKLELPVLGIVPKVKGRV